MQVYVQLVRLRGHQLWAGMSVRVNTSPEGPTAKGRPESARSKWEGECPRALRLLNSIKPGDTRNQTLKKPWFETSFPALQHRPISTSQAVPRSDLPI